MGDRDADEAAVEQIGAAHGLRRWFAARSSAGVPLTNGARVGRKQIGVAGDAVIVGAPAEGVGMEGEIALAGVEQHRALDTIVDRGGARPSLSTSKPPRGIQVGIRLFSTLTTPPIACEPQRSVAGPRITSIWPATSGSMVTAWSSPVSETSPDWMPFSWMRTRKLSWPRMTGRLAPGANVVLVMPGFANMMSPRFCPVLRWISPAGITVTVANWSVTIGSVPCSWAGSVTVGVGVGVGVGAAVRVVAGPVLAGRGAGRTIGLGAVTLTSGRSVV